MLLHHGLVGGSQVGARGFQRDTRLQPAKELRHTVHATLHHGRGKVMRAGHHVSDDFCVGRIWHRRFEHSHDGGAALAQSHRLTEHGKIALQGRGPESIGKHARACRRGAVVAGPEQASEHRMQSHHVEIRPADHARPDLAGLAESDHGKPDGRKIAEGTERGHTRLEVQEFRHGEGGIFDSQPRGTLPDIDEPILIAVDQRTQQNAAHQAEDRRVGADSESQRHHHSGSQPLAARKGPEGKFQVAHEGHDISLTSSCAFP